MANVISRKFYIRRNNNKVDSIETDTGAQVGGAVLFIDLFGKIKKCKSFLFCKP